MRLPPPRYDHCLVTGASSGIGRAFARCLARRARVLTLAARREDRLVALAGELAADHGVRCRVVAVDLAASGGPARLADEVRRSGDPVDLLVNNAGFGKHGGFADFPWDDWERMLRLNVVAAAELLWRFWDELRAEPGRGAINVASLAGFVPIPWFAGYAATKAFLRSLSNGLAGEARTSGTRLLSLCPGPTVSEFGKVAEADSRVVKRRMTAERVVEIGLSAYERGQLEVVPGAQNRLIALLAPRAPLSLVVRLASRVGRRERTTRPRSGGS